MQRPMQSKASSPRLPPQTSSDSEALRLHHTDTSPSHGAVREQTAERGKGLLKTVRRYRIRVRRRVRAKVSNRQTEDDLRDVAVKGEKKNILSRCADKSNISY